MKEINDVKILGVEKKKVILFGATKIAYETALQSINFDLVEIIAFSDNDEYKWDIEFEGIKIVSPQNILNQPYDYILICAWYSYEVIKNQLINIGIKNEKILPLLKEKSIKWLKDVITDFDFNIINKIFINGENLKKELIEVNKIIGQYENIKKVEVSSKTDYRKYPLIAHACGGYVNGKKIEYTNSFEAFQDSIKNGFKMFECDVWGVEKGKIILGSRLKMQYPISINYTIPTLDMLLEEIVNDINKKIILDIKYNTMDDFYRLLNQVDLLVQTFEKRGNRNIRDQILIETFDEESTKYATEKKWECLLTDYRNNEGRWIMKSVVICEKYKVDTLMMDARFVIKNKKYIDFILNKNLNLICYTVDEIEDYATLRKMGVKSCLSNYLKPICGRKDI